MPIALIIIICSLLLIAYIFDLISSKTKIPSVILLLILGWGMRQIAIFIGFKIPDLSDVLTIAGTLGLILIVLEGSLELEITKSKLPLIYKSFIGASLPILIISFTLAYTFNYYYGYSLKTCLINAIPLSIISSAIAIPSAKHLRKQNREFVIYETSLSDILGVLFFDFFVLNQTITLSSFEHFGFQLVIIFIISFVATAGLSLLLSKIDHSIKFAPIIILIILIYAVSKLYHLPVLIFIMFFGLFLSNLDELKRIKWINKLNPDDFNDEVHRLGEIISESMFLIRALFFLLFGFLLDTQQILEPSTLLWSLGIVAFVFLVRIVFIKLLKLPLRPLVFIAPRGLITILLFFAIVPEDRIPLVNKSLIIQVIIISALVMMVGLMFNKKEEKEENTGRKRLVVNKNEFL